MLSNDITHIFKLFKGEQKKKNLSFHCINDFKEQKRITKEVAERQDSVSQQDYFYILHKKCDIKSYILNWIISGI